MKKITLILGGFALIAAVACNKPAETTEEATTETTTETAPEATPEVSAEATDATTTPVEGEVKEATEVK